MEAADPPSKPLMEVQSWPKLRSKTTCLSPPPPPEFLPPSPPLVYLGSFGADAGSGRHAVDAAEGNEADRVACEAKPVGGRPARQAVDPHLRRLGPPRVLL